MITISGGLPRTMTREQWRYFHRLARVCAHEAAQVWHDMALYGSGAVMITGAGPRHLPFHEWYRPRS